MRRSASLIAVALLGVLGCQGGTEATSVEQETATVVVTTPTPTPTQNEQTPEEQLLRSITSCEVREIVFGHGAVTYIKFRGGGESFAKVRLGGEPAEERIAEAAYEQRCPDGKRILVGIE